MFAEPEKTVSIEVDEDYLRKVEERRELLKVWKQHKEEEEKEATALRKLEEEQQKVRQSVQQGCAVERANAHWCFQCFEFNYK